jgi:hypothetical protein
MYRKFSLTLPIEYNSEKINKRRFGKRTVSASHQTTVIDILPARNAAGTHGYPFHFAVADGSVARLTSAPVRNVMPALSGTYQVHKSGVRKWT